MEQEQRAAAFPPKAVYSGERPESGNQALFIGGLMAAIAIMAERSEIEYRIQTLSDGNNNYLNAFLVHSPSGERFRVTTTLERGPDAAPTEPISRSD